MVADELVPELVLVPSGGSQPLLPDDADGEVEVWAGNGSFEAYGYTAGGYHWAHLPGTASFRFGMRGPEVVAIPDGGVEPGLVEDAYFRNVLPLVIQLRGHEVLHASAVRTPEGVLALCGASGAGKSTLAHRLSARGHPVSADDAVVLDLDGARPTVLRVPFRLGLGADAAVFFASEPPTGETDDAAPPRSPLHALVIVQQWSQSDRPPVRITPLEPAEAFTALLPHAYYFRLSEQTRKALMLDRYLRLASSVPTFELAYRAGLGNVSTVLDLIDERVLAA